MTGLVPGAGIMPENAPGPAPDDGHRAGAGPGAIGRSDL